MAKVAWSKSGGFHDSSSSLAVWTSSPVSQSSFRWIRNCFSWIWVHVAPWAPVDMLEKSIFFSKWFQRLPGDGLVHRCMLHWGGAFVRQTTYPTKHGVLASCAWKSLSLFPGGGTLNRCSGFIYRTSKIHVRKNAARMRCLGFSLQGEGVQPSN